MQFSPQKSSHSLDDGLLVVPLFNSNNSSQRGDRTKGEPDIQVGEQLGLIGGGRILGWGEIIPPHVNRAQKYPLPPFLPLPPYCNDDGLARCGLVHVLE